jgi:hypothetical protein
MKQDPNLTSNDFGYSGALAGIASCDSPQRRMILAEFLAVGMAKNMWRCDRGEQFDFAFIVDVLNSFLARHPECVSAFVSHDPNSDGWDALKNVFP